MTQNQLSKIIEQLAVEFILIDHNDTVELNSIISLFTEIGQWASEHSQKYLNTTILEVIKISGKIINKSTDSPEDLMDIISRTISEIQLHARNDFDFSKATFPEELHVTKPTHTSSKDEHQHEYEHIITKDDPKLNEPEPIQSPTGLRHPSALPSHLDNELFAEFLGLQPDILDKMEALILLIEENDDDDSLTELKRMIHTTKGEAGFLYLDEVERICHVAEDVLEITTPAKYADIFLSVIDWLRKAFNWYRGEATTSPEPVEPIMEKIKQIETKLTSAEKSEKLNFDFNTMVKEFSDRIVTNPVKKVKIPDIFFLQSVSYIHEILDSASSTLSLFMENPSETNKIAELISSVSKVSAVSSLFSMAEIEFLASETNNLMVQMVSKKDLQSLNIAGIVLESFTTLKQLNTTFKTSITKDITVPKDSELPKLLAHIRAASFGLFVESEQQKPDINQCQNISAPEYPEIIYEETAEVDNKESTQAKVSTQIKETINVDAERLDKIIDMVGELVIAESMVIQAEEIKTLESQVLNRHLNQMDKITRSLQETSLSLRMLPIKSTFQKMGRIVRDTAKKSGKNVKFLMYGEDTELDKTVVDKIGDPLLHMVRNSIDHGIEESAEHRIAVGKPEQGTVIMRAFHKGGNIHIVIEDDGRGLNRQSIISKAVERKLIDKETILNDQEVFNLIFEQGFSTASEITDISGRGVGMNVVRTSIESLHGQVDIKSDEGKGSVFTIRIPLTLAIIDGMVVKVGKERFIIPTLSIITSSRLIIKEVTSVFKNSKMIEIQGKLVPLFKLSELFKTRSLTHNSDYTLIIVVEEDGNQVALAVDEILGKQQIVIKTLGKSMQNIPGISGGAIMPDGIVGLIIDVAGLVRMAHNKSAPGPDISDHKTS